MKNSRPLPIWLAAVSLCVVGCNSAIFPAKSPAAGSGGISPAAAATPTFPDITMKSQAGRVAVIMYHDVIAKRDKNSVWFDCTVDEFQKDIDEILLNGFTVLSLDQLYDH